MKPEPTLAEAVCQLHQRAKNASDKETLIELAQRVGSSHHRIYSENHLKLITAPGFDQLHSVKLMNSLELSGLPFDSGVNSWFFEGPSFLDGDLDRPVGVLVEKNKNSEGYTVSLIEDVADNHKGKRLLFGSYQSTLNNHVYSYTGTSFAVGTDDAGNRVYNYMNTVNYVDARYYAQPDDLTQLSPEQILEIEKDKLQKVFIFASRMMLLMQHFPELKQAPLVLANNGGKKKPNNNVGKARRGMMLEAKNWRKVQAILDAKTEDRETADKFRLFQYRQAEAIRRLLGLPTLAEFEKPSIHERMMTLQSSPTILSERMAEFRKNGHDFFEQAISADVLNYDDSAIKIVQEGFNLFSREEIIRMFKRVADRIGSVWCEGDYFSPTGKNLCPSDPDFKPMHACLVTKASEALSFTSLYTTRGYIVREPDYDLNPESTKQNKKLGFSHFVDLLVDDALIEGKKIINQSSPADKKSYGEYVWADDKEETQRYVLFTMAMITLAFTRGELAERSGFNDREPTLQSLVREREEKNSEASGEGKIRTKRRMAPQDNNDSHLTIIDPTRPKKKASVGYMRPSSVTIDDVWEVAKQEVREATKKQWDIDHISNNAAPSVLGYLYREMEFFAKRIFGPEYTVKIKKIRDSEPYHKPNRNADENGIVEESINRGHVRIEPVLETDDENANVVVRAAYQLKVSGVDKLLPSGEKIKALFLTADRPYANQVQQQAKSEVKL